VLRVGDGVSSDVLEEDVEHAMGPRTSAWRCTSRRPRRQPPDRRLCDALDVAGLSRSTFKWRLAPSLSRPLPRPDMAASVMNEQGTGIRRFK
jgi:hypothetical protein